MKPDCLLVLPGADEAEAQRLAERLALPVTADPSAVASAPLFLRLDADGLTLVGGALTLRGDFSELLPRVRPAALNAELLVKAVRFRTGRQGSTVLDGTAGLGEDSFLLAASGQTVTLYESDPVIAALLRDALRRAAADPVLSEIAARMALCEGDSVAAMRGLTNPPDVIYLDPMFPERRKSGLIKKKFQLLHELERPCADEDALLSAALDARPRRVVVKRPAKAPPLADRKPSYTLTGSTIRYDCYIP